MKTTQRSEFASIIQRNGGRPDLLIAASAASSWLKPTESPSSTNCISIPFRRAGQAPLKAV